MQANTKKKKMQKRLRIRISCCTKTYKQQESSKMFEGTTQNTRKIKFIQYRTYDFFFTHTITLHFRSRDTIFFHP